MIFRRASDPVQAGSAAALVLPPAANTHGNDQVLVAETADELRPRCFDNGTDGRATNRQQPTASTELRAPAVNATSPPLLAADAGTHPA